MLKTKGKELIERAIKNVKSVDAKWDEASLNAWYLLLQSTEMSQWKWDDLLSVLEQCKDIQRKLNNQ